MLLTMQDLHRLAVIMYGLTEIGLPVVAVIIGEKVIGEGQEDGFGYQAAGNQDPMVGTGDVATGDRIKCKYREYPKSDCHATTQRIAN